MLYMWMTFSMSCKIMKTEWYKLNINDEKIIYRKIVDGLFLYLGGKGERLIAGKEFTGREKKSPRWQGTVWQKKISVMERSEICFVCFLCNLFWDIFSVSCCTEIQNHFLWASFSTLPIKAWSRNNTMITLARILFHFLILLPSFAVKIYQNVPHEPERAS